ncbi:MAG: hypothetical protein K2N35_17775 [Muribaculaceae bacterium]|nr:hypothetical protein [Muribaculaceae bacterium]
MDLQELNDDRKMISGANKLNNLIDRGFSDRAKSLVTNHSIIGGIALALPLMGFDNIVYLIVLWHMYYGLCELANKSFGSNKTKSFVGAIIVNLIVATVLELACNVIPVVGGIIGGFIIGFASIKISGAAYLKALEIAHNGNVAERYSFNNKKLY